MSMAYNDLDGDVVFEKLMHFGLFPEKMKDVFSSELFGDWVLNNNIKKYFKKRDVFSPVVFRLTRNNNIPRILTIPHPLVYTELCFCIRKNWDNINRSIGKTKGYSDISMIIPRKNNKNRRLVSMQSYGKNRKENLIILQKQLGKKYLAYADISNCFSTIYSHSICWALVGKKKSKKNQFDKEAWYNQIDYCVRRIKNNETSGILTGPDASNIISEIILSAVDKEMGDYDYVRYIDDYMCYCDSREKADKFIKDLSGYLNLYCLNLNAQKTRIVELPLNHGTDWVNILQEFSENNFNGFVDISYKKKLVRFLDIAVSLSKTGDNVHSIKYAMKMLSNKYYLDYDAYELVIKYLGNLCFLYPYNVDSLDDLFSIGNVLDRAKFKQHAEDIIDYILKEHISSRKSDVIVWSLFLSIKYDLEIKDLSRKRKNILFSRDCMSVLMILMYDRYRGEDISDYYKVVKELIKSDVECEWWVFIYELYRLDARTFKIKMRSYDVKHLDFYKGLANGGVSFLCPLIIKKIT